MIPIKPTYNKSVIQSFRRRFREFSNFIDDWNKNKWKGQKDIKFTSEFKKFEFDLQEFSGPIIENFSGRCVYCADDFDVSISCSHPVDKNLECPDLCMDINNLIVVCRACSERISITYKKSKLLQKKKISTEDLIKKIPSIVMPTYEPAHKYFDYNRIENELNEIQKLAEKGHTEEETFSFRFEFLADRLKYTIESLHLEYLKISFEELFSEKFLGGKLGYTDRLDFEYSVYKEIWTRFHKEGKFGRKFNDDYDFANSLRLNKELIKFSIPDQDEVLEGYIEDYFKFKTIKFSNLRCFDEKSVNFNSTRGLFVLGDNGLGKSTFLDICSLFGSRKNREALYGASDRFIFNSNDDLRISLLVESFNNGLNSLDVVIKRKGSSRNIFPKKYDLLPICYVKTGRTNKTFIGEFSEMLLDDAYFSEVSKVCSYILNLEENQGFVRHDGGIYIVTDGSGEKELFSVSSGVTSIFKIVHSIFRAFGRQYKRGEVPSGFKRGIVLIDELELHLHPKWKNQIALKLMEIFNDLFFIVTTHDPLILKGLNSRDVIVMNRDSENSITNINDNLPDFDGYSSDILLSSPYFGLEEIGGGSKDMDVEISNSYREYLSRKVVKESLELNLNHSAEDLSLLVANKFNQVTISEED